MIESQLAMRRKRPGSTIVLLFGLALVGLSTPDANAAGEKRTRRVGVPTPPAMQPDSTAATATPPRADTTGTSSESSRAGRRKPAAPVGDVVRFGQSFSIHEDEVVSGDVVLLGGDLKVEGEIQGGAVVLGGNIEIGRRAQVRGEAISVGGRVDAAPGANVRGGTVSLNFLPSPLLGGRDWQHAQRLGALLGDGLQVFLWSILSALCVAFGAAKLRRTTATIAQTPGRCVGLGILALTGGLFSVVMLIVLLALTLVGLPLALLLAVAALVFLAAAQVVGLTRLGAALATRLGWRTRSTFAAAALGIAAVTLPKLAADLLRLGDPSRLVVVLQIVHGVMVVVLLAAGVGALVLSRVGARRPQAPPWRAAAAASLPASTAPAASAPSAD